MYKMTRKAMYDIFGDIVMHQAVTAAWHGDEYTHPKHGVCRAVFYGVWQNEIVCLLKPGSTQPVAFYLMQRPQY
ncbi:hypothetical protein [Paralysiella testudinis]|uniref:Uncharacterized protein n=1 Tax=Paralysiella testudinis TaxID=2809020 RepID=A0A892ZG58_9NEIS|nr:hypothetical protein [Paralysiella testudinis]QRQ81922.1 hypothetical protein JQU52_00285 [Paralysiella testudinis]